jgi:hypothetical protein
MGDTPRNRHASNTLLQIFFAPNVADELRERAKADGTTVSELVRRAVMDKYKLKVRR